jgi:tyrosyl-tRNA synthetase
MTKVLTDEKLIDKFLDRGVEAIYPSREELRRKLMSGERLRVYQGFDPTGKYLHVGHAMGIRALGILQQLGHEVIFLVGDYTAKVGDPDKDTGREMLTEEQIESNLSGWQEQASQLINFEGENPVKFQRNYELLAGLKLDDIIKLMSHITVQRMLERDMFERRIKEGDPIGLHEFIYPLMQGYDGVAMNVDMEIGGADQTFNMLMGRTLSRAYNNKEKFVRANKMMDAPDGRTMSKTKGNGINLGDTAEDMYGKAMSYRDESIPKGLELLTDLPMEEVKQIEKDLESDTNPMEYKKKMAFEIVKMIKGEESARRAEAHFERTVQHKEAPEETETYTVSEGEKNIVELLVETGLASSKGEARRLVEQGGIKADKEPIRNIDHTLKLGEEPVLLQRGKRRFIKVSCKI